MTAEATFVRERHDRRIAALAAAIVSGEVYQLADGLAAVSVGLNAGSAGDARHFTTEGQHVVAKTASVLFTNGQEVWWDRSAGSATFAPGDDRDFFLGTCVGDPAAADVTMTVNLNAEPSYYINLQDDEFLSVIVKTVVGSTTVEVPHIKPMGGAQAFIFGATAEAQKLDLFSKRKFAVGSKWIAEFVFDIIDDGDAAAIDFNVGVANATHASDANSITQRCLVHTDANVLDILAWSTDGTTTVALTDTTVDYALGTPVHVVLDGRNPADIQIIINGVLILGSTVFKLDAASGPLGLLAHIEKTADDETADYRICKARVRLMEQAAA